MPRLFLLIIGGLLAAWPVTGQRLQGVDALPAQLKQAAGIERVQLLMETGSYYLYLPGEEKTDLDSAELCLRQAIALAGQLQADSLQQRARCLLGNTFFERFTLADIQKGRACYLQVIDYYRHTGDKMAEVATWRALGHSIPTLPPYIDEVVDAYEHARRLYKQMGDHRLEIDMQKAIADAHLNAGRLDLAATELKKVVQDYQAIHYPLLHYTYDLLAQGYRLKGDYEQALDYSLKAVQSMQQTHDTDMALTFYSRLAEVYRDLEEPARSVVWYRKAMDKWAGRKQRNAYRYYTAGELARELIKLDKEQEALAFTQELVQKEPPLSRDEKASVYGTLAYCYVALHRYDQAAGQYAQMVFWLQGLPKDNHVAEAWLEISRFYIQRGRYGDSRQYLDSVMTMPAGIVSLSDMSQVQLMYFRVDSAMGNYLTAVGHLQQHKELDDSIFSINKSRQVERLQVQYETAQREQAIANLQQQAGLQQQALQQANRVRNLSLAGGGMLLMIVILLWGRYRQRQHNNEQLKIQQTEIQARNASLAKLVTEKDGLLKEKEWLLREVHHRVKNNLQIVMSLLNTQSVYLDNPEAVAAIRDSQHRMQAMSLIHQKLYQSGNISLIDMPSYIKELVGNLRDNFDTGHRILFDMEIAAVKLDIARAVPVGLILNEAVTNAVKYAFPGNAAGTIRIILRKENDRLWLTIADDGVGLPEGLDVGSSHSLGMNLMQGLTTQLKGDFSIHHKKGVSIVICLPTGPLTEAEKIMFTEMATYE